MRVDIDSHCLTALLIESSISAFEMDLKRILIPHNLFRDFGAGKTSTFRWSGCRVQVWVQVRAPAGHLTITPEGYSRRQLVLRIKFWLQNQWPSSWGRAPAQLGRVGRASTNTGRFRVGGSRCGPRPARLRKTCYHSCDTDSVQESTRF